MPRRWHRFRNPWQREYAMRGSLWRGIGDASPLLPFVAPGERVLELGCGDGKFVAALESRGYDAVGVDFASQALRLARKRVRAAYAVADARRLPFRDGAGSAIAARYVMGALDQDGRGRCVSEIGRVLASDGILLVEEFGRNDFRYGTGNLVEPHTFERNRGITTHYFLDEEMTALFSSYEVLSQESSTSTQPTNHGPKQRQRLRWVFRRPR